VASVLVTGAGGFLGALVAEEFEQQGWRVIRFGRSRRDAVRNPKEFVSASLPDHRLVEVLKGEKPAVCVHCAGPANPRLSLAEPVQDFTDGPQLTTWLMDVLRRHSPHSRVVFPSSAAVYGNPTVMPVSESSAKRPISPYGYHKLESELVLESFHNIFWMTTTALRIFSAYGPGLLRQVVWDSFNKIAAHPIVSVEGTGEESRDFIFGHDVARAVFHVATMREPDAVYNLATGVETSIRGLIEALSAEMRLQRDIRFEGSSIAGVPSNWKADISRLEATGWHPTVPLEEGLRRTIASWRGREG